jgi:hypothetical protein
MSFYDTIVAAPEQLGEDIHLFSSHGADWAIFPLPGQSSGGNGNWDGRITVSGQADFGQVPVAPWMADIVLHEGQPVVAWCEPQWNGTNVLMRGPFVKRWNGSTWEQLSGAGADGEVDPSIVPVALTVSPDPPGSTLGVRSAPARPYILSDGESLFCVYTVREVAHAPNPGTIIVPSHIGGMPCGCYYNTCDTTDYSLWKPRKVYVRRWNGSTWELWGSMPADANNGHISNDFGGPQPYAEIEIHAWASSAEPGIVYVGMYERGFVSAATEQWFSGPSLTCLFGIQLGGTPYYAGYYSGAKMGRFDGGSGTIKTISAVASVNGSNQSTVQAPQQAPGPGPFWVVNNSGTGYAIWAERGTQNLHMTDFPTLTNQQTLFEAASFPSTSRYAVGYDASRGKYILFAFTLLEGVMEIPIDASSNFVPIYDGIIPNSYAIAPQVPCPPCIRYPEGPLIGESTTNMWALSTSGYTLTEGLLFWTQLHTPCTAWAQYEYVAPPPVFPPDDPDPVLVYRNIGMPRLVYQDNKLYAVAMFFNFNDDSIDTTVKVYTVDICRDCGGCGRVARPDLNTRFDLHATGDPGTPGPPDAHAAMNARFALSAGTTGTTGPIDANAGIVTEFNLSAGA